MKYLIAIALTGLSIFQLCAQSDCDARLDNLSILSNDFRQSSIFSLANLNFEGSVSDPFYDGDGTTKLFDLGFAKGVWAGGYDPSGNLKVAASGYGVRGSDFVPGPIWEDFQGSADLCEFFRKTWMISSFDVALIKSQFENGTLRAEDIPSDILHWPAIGNPHILEVDIENELAPFYDNNGDGLYDPLAGDYPIPLKESPDFVPYRFRFYVFNDETAHEESNGVPLDMEFQVMDYVVDCPQQNESETSIYTRIKYINRGLEDLRDFRFGIWEDTDLGCLSDDNVGCSPELTASYTYDSGGIDAMNCQNGIVSIPEEYGAVRSLVFLNQSLAGFSYFFNGGFGNPPVLAGLDPQRPEHYYNYLNSLWQDGTPITTGGNGYNPGSTDISSYVFTDFPNEAGGWSMQEELVQGLDVRSVSIAGVEETVAPQQSGIVDLVDHLLIRQNAGLNIFDEYESSINTVKQDYADMLQGQFECGALPEVCESDCVWPGDVNNDGLVTGRDLVMIGNYLGLGGETGPARANVSSYWFPFSSIDWEKGLFGLDARFADVDGNGEVELLDGTKADQNLGLSRVEWYPNEVLEENNAGDMLHIEYFDEDPIDASTSNFLDRQITARLSLGELGEELIAPIHGLSYEIRIDTNVFAMDRRFYSPRTNFENNGSYVGDLEERDELYFGKNKIIYYHTNVDGENRTSYTSLPFAGFIVRDDAKTANPDGRDTLVIKFYNVFGTNAAGEELSFGAAYDRIIVTNMIVDPDLVSGTSEVEWEPSFSMQPNPTSDHLDLKFSETQKGELILHSIAGKRLASYELNNQENLRIEVGELDAGLYILTFKTAKGVISSERFVKN